MELTESLETNLVEDIKTLINKGNNEVALCKLNTLEKDTPEWNYLYSLYLYNKSWFDSSLTYIKKAIFQDPANEEYREALEELSKFSDSTAVLEGVNVKYHRHHHHHHHHHHRTFCCIPCDCCCCDVDCCDCDCCDCHCCDVDCCD